MRLPGVGAGALSGHGSAPACPGALGPLGPAGPLAVDRAGPQVAVPYALAPPAPLREGGRGREQTKDYKKTNTHT